MLENFFKLFALALYEGVDKLYLLVGNFFLWVIGILVLMKVSVVFQEGSSHEKVWFETTVIKYVKSAAKWLIDR
jgi:hypothetical protein